MTRKKTVTLMYLSNLQNKVAEENKCLRSVKVVGENVNVCPRAVETRIG